MEKQENLQIPDQNNIEKAARKKALEERAAEYGLNKGLSTGFPQNVDAREKIV